MEAKLKELLDEHMSLLREGKPGIKDVKQYAFEIAMEHLYGKDIWKEYNKLV